MVVGDVNDLMGLLPESALMVTNGLPTASVVAF
jgi:hypothetical protein